MYLHTGVAKIMSIVLATGFWTLLHEDIVIGNIIALFIIIHQVVINWSSNNWIQEPRPKAKCVVGKHLKRVVILR